MTELRLAGVDVRLGGAQIVRDLHLECPSGAFVGLLGPNGSGKSTTLKTVYRALAPAAGQVLLDDRDLLRELTARQSARHVAALTQDAGHDFEFTVLEVVATGLTPHKNAWSPTTRADRRQLHDVLDTVGMLPHAGRPFGCLSGGEKQRVLLARALAQRPTVLVLDEPTNHLDISTQLGLLRLVRSLGITVLAALHDLNLAAAYCDRVYLLRDGALVCAGSPPEVLTPDRIADVFGVRAHCGVHPITGRLQLAFDHLDPDHDTDTDGAGAGDRAPELVDAGRAPAFTTIPEGNP